jgi:hypothetical protein
VTHERARIAVARAGDADTAAPGDVDTIAELARLGEHGEDGSTDHPHRSLARRVAGGPREAGSEVGADIDVIADPQPQIAHRAGADHDLVVGLGPVALQDGRREPALHGVDREPVHPPPPDREAAPDATDGQPFDAGVGTQDGKALRGDDLVVGGELGVPRLAVERGRREQVPQARGEHEGGDERRDAEGHRGQRASDRHQRPAPPGLERHPHAELDRWRNGEMGEDPAHR